MLIFPDYFVLLYLIPPAETGNQLFNIEHLNLILEEMKRNSEYVSHTDLSTITISWMFSNPVIRL
jgi:hypothetical protein